MKKGKWLVPLALVLALTGCGDNGTSASSEETAVVPVAQEEKVYKLSEEHFKAFFDQYFSFTDTEILQLNQVRDSVDETYWNNLRKNYNTLIKEKLEKYLTPEVVEKTGKQYLHDQLNMPKWVLLNGYAVSGNAKVEALEIRSTRDLGEEVIYEVAVKTRNTCMPATMFDEKYAWSSEAGYWVERVAGQEYEYNADLEQHKAISEHLEQQEDEMKLEQHFWITVKKDDAIQITQISNVELWGVGTSNKQQGLDTHHITRLPYKEKANAQETNTITKVFDFIINSSKDDMVYYSKAYDTGTEAFIQMWGDVGLSNEVAVDEENYTTHYPKTITPYKDEITQLDITAKGIICVPSVYGTKNHPRFIVEIPVKALLNNNQVVYYNYKYYVGLKNGKIDSIQFIEMEEGTEEELDVLVEEFVPSEEPGATEETVSGEESGATEEAAVPGEESGATEEAVVPGEVAETTEETAAPSEESVTTEEVPTAE